VQKLHKKHQKTTHIQVIKGSFYHITGIYEVIS